MFLTDGLRTRRPRRRFNLRHQSVAKSARARIPAGRISRAPRGFSVQTLWIRVREDAFRHVRLCRVAVFLFVSVVLLFRRLASVRRFVVVLVAVVRERDVDDVLLSSSSVVVVRVRLVA